MESGLEDGCSPFAFNVLCVTDCLQKTECNDFLYMYMFEWVCLDLHYCTMLPSRPIACNYNVRAFLSPLQMATPRMILSFTGEVETAQCLASIE